MWVLFLYAVTLFLSINNILNLKGLTTKQQRMNILICVVFPIWGILLKLSSGDPAKGSHFYSKNQFSIHTDKDNTEPEAEHETDDHVKPYADTKDNEIE